MRHGELPSGVVPQRTTPDFDAHSVPAGLLRAHELAPHVWGELEVVAGRLAFVWEGDAPNVVDLRAGDSLVIRPATLHHVETAPDAVFRITFHH